MQKGCCWRLQLSFCSGCFWNLSGFQFIGAIFLPKYEVLLTCVIWHLQLSISILLCENVRLWNYVIYCPSSWSFMHNIRTCTAHYIQVHMNVFMGGKKKMVCICKMHEDE